MVGKTRLFFLSPSIGILIEIGVLSLTYFVVRGIESIDSCPCARLRKSRDDTLRLATCIQEVEGAFYLLENYRIQYRDFGKRQADDQFYQTLANYWQ